MIRGIQAIRLPLFVRVVAAYVLVSVPIWLGVSFLQPSPREIQVASIITADQLVKFETSTRVSGEPVRIYLPRLGVDLTIIDGQYNKATDSWTLTDTQAQFARMTELPNNEAGNTFIYGHNTAAVFAPLAQLQPGDEAIVYTSNGHSFSYVYTNNHIVQPTTTSILAPSETPTLTLMTCEGVFSEARRVAVFDFKGVT